MYLRDFHALVYFLPCPQYSPAVTFRHPRYQLWLYHPSGGCFQWHSSAKHRRSSQNPGMSVEMRGYSDSAGAECCIFPMNGCCFGVTSASVPVVRWSSRPVDVSGGQNGSILGRLREGPLKCPRSELWLCFSHGVDAGLSFVRSRDCLSV